MSDGKMLNDALEELRDACGLPEGVSVSAMARKAAALAREAMAARKLARCRQLMAQASHPGGESEMTPDAQEYVRARRASGAAARAAAGE